MTASNRSSKRIASSFAADPLECTLLFGGVSFSAKRLHRVNSRGTRGGHSGGQDGGDNDDCRGSDQGNRARKLKLCNVIAGQA